MEYEIGRARERLVKAIGNLDDAHRFLIEAYQEAQKLGGQNNFNPAHLLLWPQKRIRWLIRAIERVLDYLQQWQENER